MAMVFNRDVLFLHVPKTGGVSVTNYLLQVLPAPVYYVTKGPGKQAGDREGVSFIAGEAHQTLETAHKFLPAHGFELEQFPRILATLRNPYDLIVSYYTYKRSPEVEFTLLDAALAPGAPGELIGSTPGRSRLQERLVEALAKLQPGTVGRFEPTGSEALNQLGKELHRVAVDQGRPVETWTHGGAIYATLRIRPQKTFRNVHLSRHFDFPEFLHELTASGRNNHLSRMSKYYFLDGEMPANLRILRFERLADEVRDALKEIGIRGDAEFPWLNRSDHGPYVDYYDALSERLVFEECRWVFEQGHYRRLRFGDSAPNETEPNDASVGRS
jgi:hypothetical protein